MTTLYRVRTMPEVEAIDRELRLRRDGWAVVHVRPETLPVNKTVSLDLLDAFGRSISPNSNHGRAEMASLRMVVAWLSAGVVDHVVLASANYLPSNVLVDMCAACATGGVRTWLLYDIDPNEERERALQGLAPVETPAARFLAERADSPIACDVGIEEAFPAVPDTHFLGFITLAGDVLDESSLCLVNDRYHEGMAGMAGWIASTPDAGPEEVGKHLHEMTAHVRDVNELTSIVRGAQAGAFTKGLNLGVDITRFANRTSFASLPTRLRDAEWALINRIRRPWEAAVCVLTAMGLDQAEIAGLPATAVEDGGSSIHLPDRDCEVPEQGRGTLVAQHVYRLLGPPGQGDRFLYRGLEETELTEHWIGRLLLMLARDTGVALRMRAAQPGGRGAHWTCRVGITVSRLAS